MRTENQEFHNLLKSNVSFTPLLPAHARSTKDGFSNMLQVSGCISPVLQKGKLITSILLSNLIPDLLSPLINFE